MTNIFEKDLTNKKNFIDAKEENGSVESTNIFEGDNPNNLPFDLEVALTQQAYAQDGFKRKWVDLPLDDDKPFYTAHGVDKEGNEYKVIWDVVEDWEDVEDEQEMCDWDNPVSIEKI